MTEKRRNHRCPATAQAHVYWTDAEGRYWQERAAITESSASGLRVVLRNRIAERTQVSVRSGPGAVMVSASVRHVRQKGLVYITGLELPMPESHQHE